MYREIHFGRGCLIGGILMNGGYIAALKIFESYRKNSHKSFNEAIQFFIDGALLGD